MKDKNKDWRNVVVLIVLLLVALRKGIMRKTQQHQSPHSYILYRVIGLVILIYVGGFFVGCMATVKTHISQSEFLVSGDRNPGTVQLYITEAFKSYKETKTDMSDLKKWEFQLGLVAIDAFRYGLESRFTDVSVEMGEPIFPIQKDNPGAFFTVVQPRFHSFEASDPFMFKFENYTAEITFLVDVYDAEGTKLLSKQYYGKGEKRGSIGFESSGHEAYPVAVGNAVKDAVDQFLNDLIYIASKSEKVSHLDGILGKGGERVRNPFYQNRQTIPNRMKVVNENAGALNFYN